MRHKNEALTKFKIFKQMVSRMKATCEQKFSELMVVANTCPKISRSFANNMAFIGNILRLTLCNKTKSQNEWIDLCWRKQEAWCWMPRCQNSYGQKEWTQHISTTTHPPGQTWAYTRALFRKETRLLPSTNFWVHSFVHIVEEDKNKLEPKSCEGVLVGYDEVTKGYRCLIP